MSYAAIALTLGMATIARAQPPPVPPPDEPASSEPASSEPASSEPAHVEGTADPAPVDADPAPVDAASATASSTATPARPSRKSEVVAVLLPVGVTVGGLAVFSLFHHTESPWPGIEPTARNVAVGVTGIAALVIGPSLGQLYAGKLWTTALPVRLAGALVAGTGVVLVATRPQTFRLATPREVVGLLLMGVGAISYVGGSIYEIRTSPHSVRAYNERTTRTELTVVPVVSETSAGFTLVGAF